MNICDKRLAMKVFLKSKHLTYSKIAKFLPRSASRQYVAQILKSDSMFGLHETNILNAVNKYFKSIGIKTNFSLHDIYNNK